MQFDAGFFRQRVGRLDEVWFYDNEHSYVEFWDPHANQWYTWSTCRPVHLDQLTRGADVLLIKLPWVQFVLGLGYELKKLDAWKRATLKAW